MNQNINMTVSTICAKNGKKYAYVSFTDADRSAEGKIPDCKIISNQGFTKEEVQQLEIYMAHELPQLKQMAAGIRLFDAIMK